MLISTPIPLALIGLFHCHISAAQYSNSSSGQFREGYQEHRIILSIPISSTPSLHPYLSNSQLSNGTRLAADDFDTVSSTFVSQSSDTTGLDGENPELSSTSNASRALSEDENNSNQQTTTPKKHGTSNIEDEVDFSQWINTNMLEEDNIPLPSMPWDNPDYGPSHKSGKQKDVTESHSSSPSWLFSKLPDHLFLGLDSSPDDDDYFSYSHSTDSDGDGGLAPCLKEDFSGKFPWHEDDDGEEHYYAGTSTENNTYRWLLSPTALDGFFKAGERSSSEESYGFNNEPISVRNLALGLTGVATLLKKDRRKKGNSTPDEEMEDANGMLSLPETIFFSREQLIKEVKEIYAGFAIMEAKSFGFETWDDYFESKYSEVQSKLVKLPDEPTHIAEQWTRNMRRAADDEQKSQQICREVGHDWSSKTRGKRPYDHLAKLGESHALKQQPLPFSPNWDAAISSLQSLPSNNQDMKLAMNLTQKSPNTQPKPTSHDPWEGSSKHYIPKQTAHSSTSQYSPSSTTSSLTTTTIPSVPQASSPTNKLLSPNTTKHICPTCSSSFNRAFEFRKHFKYHSKPIDCPIPNCAHRFACQRDLKRHQKAAHRDMHCAEQWFCAVLGCRYNIVPFGRKDNLLRHVRNVHIGEEGMGG